MIKSRIIILAIAIPFAFAGCTSDKQENSKPNIILIMSDDMGYSDIGCYGGARGNLCIVSNKCLNRLYLYFFPSGPPN